MSDVEKIFFSLLAIVGTVLIFLAMRKLYRTYPNPLLHPVLTATTVIALILVLTKVPYVQYKADTKWIEELLGACVVTLAYPFYKQKKTMLRYAKTVSISIVVGVITAFGSILLFSKLFKVEQQLFNSMLAKSITTPVAIQITEVIGGIPSLAVTFVMIAGFTGVILGPPLMDRLKIHHPISRGLALGSASHALGVAKSTEYGELCLSMATVSMTVSAIIGAFVGPLIVTLFI
mgnify:CR=1 FL=1